MAEKPVAIVTGASRGIGKQTCLRLAERGFRLALAARTEAPRAGTPGTLGQTLDELKALGAEAMGVRADMAIQEDLDQLVAQTLERSGRIDALVNNAAYTVGRTLFTHVPDLSRDQWEKHFAVNVTAPLMLIQGCWRAMVAQGGGVIVNLTSGSSYPRELDQGTNLEGIPENGPAYGSSKAAINQMSNLVAGEGAPHRIAVIAVDPGTVLTETMELTLGPERASRSPAISTHIPASVIAYLCGAPDAMAYSGKIVRAPELHARLGL